LGESAQIRDDPEQLMGTTDCDTESGLDLVDDQDRPVLVAETTQPFEESGSGHDPESISQHGLDDDRGDAAALTLEQTLGAGAVVEGEGADVGAHRLGNPRT